LETVKNDIEEISNNYYFSIEKMANAIAHQIAILAITKAVEVRI
jgi:hypothetical protein